jgi:glycosyltransferase involved in cell wall biosynthesis
MIDPSRITVVVSTYNHLRPLELCLAGFRHQTRPPGEILIADDGSGAETRGLIEKLLPSLPSPARHLWHEDKGFRKNIILNRCLAAARGDYLVLTDADCIPHPRYVEDHAALAEPGFWVQGRRCYLNEAASSSLAPGRKVPGCRLLLAGKLSGAAKGFRLPFPVIRRDTGQRGIIGCNMAAWKQDLLKINGWDEEYEGWGLGEDSDLGSRLYHLGRPRKFVYGRAILYHLHHPILNRDHIPQSQARLEETLRTKKVRCSKGVDQYLK